MEGGESLEVIKNLCEKRGSDVESLIAILQDIQLRFGYVSEEAVDGIARELSISHQDLRDTDILCTVSTLPSWKAFIESVPGNSVSCHGRRAHFKISFRQTGCLGR